MLFVITIALRLEKLVCILLWQICLVDALRGHPAEHEPPKSIIIGFFLGIPIYASLVYLFIRNRKLRNEK